MIINDDSSIVSKGSFKLSDDPRVVNDDCHRFIVQATRVDSRVTRLGEISPFGHFLWSWANFILEKNCPMTWAKF
jgi:hypothetical protein